MEEVEGGGRETVWGESHAFLFRSAHALYGSKHVNVLQYCHGRILYRLTSGAASREPFIGLQLVLQSGRCPSWPSRSASAATPPRSRASSTTARVDRLRIRIGIYGHIFICISPEPGNLMQHMHIGGGTTFLFRHRSSVQHFEIQCFQSGVNIGVSDGFFGFVRHRVWVFHISIYTYSKRK